MPYCAYTSPMTTNVHINSNNLYYQSAFESNTIYDQEASDPSYQMATNEVDSWLLSNPDNDQMDGSMNLQSHDFCGGSQYQANHKLTFIIWTDEKDYYYNNTASLLPMAGGIAPEATFGTMDLPQEYWAPNYQFSFSPSYPGNLINEAVGTYSNSLNTSISSLGPQQLISQDDSRTQPEYPPMTRQDRILRYIVKKKVRKYEKKMIYSSRKTYAQTRPRIRGRFARRTKQMLMTKQLLK
ncbi:zinc finger protein CONSTANS-LIKE 2-like [Bidens hawaiensis]|uniref:zinc finger protein CONSTANS-LIKE 2-like n=1 Tax=Bidens hawaiensis TaxID=980011 RepID=UPI00404B61D1